MAMNKNVSFIWRVSYRNEATLSETTLAIAHEKVRQFLQRNLQRK